MNNNNNTKCNRKYDMVVFFVAVVVVRVKCINLFQYPSVIASFFPHFSEDVKGFENILQDSLLGGRGASGQGRI